MSDFKEEDEIDVLSESENQILIGMTFKTKNEVIYAVRFWSIAQNREIYVNKSEPRLFNAICCNRHIKFTPTPGTPICHNGIFVQ